MDTDFEQRERQEAERQTQAGRLPEAAARWEILTLLRPDNQEYASKLSAVRDQAASKASEAIASASEARQRGDLQRAATLYLRALSADPRSPAAASGLRDLERVLSQRHVASGKQPLEHSAKLEAGAAAETARAVKNRRSAAPADAAPPARKELAQDYYEQGLRVQRTDLDAAIRLWERALEYDPGHAQAKLRLEQGRRMQETMRAGSASESKP